MRVVLFIVLFITNLLAQKVLLINSNGSIDKYSSAQKGFESSYDKPFKSIDISKMTQYQIKEYLYDEYPDVVYCIGTKAFLYANKYIPEKKIFFSSIVNYKRFNMSKNSFGVSNEVHTGMKLTLIKNMFPNIKRLKIVYSKYTKDIYESYKNMLDMVKLEVVGENVNDINMQQLSDLFDNIDGFILIPDPVYIKDENFVNNLFKLSKKVKKPIFAYHELFLEYGALLSISVDGPTVGRQVSNMLKIENRLNSINSIQMPMGTKIILNKNILNDYAIEHDQNIFSQVNKVVE